MSRYNNLVCKTIPSSLVEWLNGELEKRGIDASYSHWILSILNDHSNSTDTDDFLEWRDVLNRISKRINYHDEYILPESVFSVKSKYQKRKENIKQILSSSGFSRSLMVTSDPIYKNKNDAINCLKSVSDDNSIKDLVNEVCRRMDKLANDESERKNLEKSMIEDETPFYIQPSSPTDQVEKYCAAFPPLERRKEETVDSIQLAQCNISYNNWEMKSKNFVQDILRRSDLNSIKSADNLETEPKEMPQLMADVFRPKNVSSKVLNFSKRSHPYKDIENSSKKIPSKKAILSNVETVTTKRISARRVESSSSLEKNQNILENIAIKFCSNMCIGNSTTENNSCVETDSSGRKKFRLPFEEMIAIKGTSILFAVMQNINISNLDENEVRKLFTKIERCSYHKNIPFEFLCIVETSSLTCNIDSKDIDVFCQCCKLELLPLDEAYVKIADHIGSGKMGNRRESSHLPFPGQKTFYKNFTFPLRDVALVILGNIACHNFSQEGFIHFFSISESSQTIITDNVNLTKDILKEFCMQINMDKDVFSESLLRSMFFEKENFPLCNEKMKLIQFHYDSIYHSNCLPKIIASVTEKEIGRERKFGNSQKKPQTANNSPCCPEMNSEVHPFCGNLENSSEVDERDKQYQTTNNSPGWPEMNAEAHPFCGILESSSKVEENDKQYQTTNNSPCWPEMNAEAHPFCGILESSSKIEESDKQYQTTNNSPCWPEMNAEAHPFCGILESSSQVEESDKQYQITNNSPCWPEMNAEAHPFFGIWENSSEIGKSKGDSQISNNSPCWPEMNSEINKEAELLSDIFATTTSRNDVNLYSGDQPISSDKKFNTANTYPETQELDENTNEFYEPYASFPNFVAMQTEAKISDNSLIPQNDSHLYPVNPIYQGAMHSYAYQESPLYDESAVHSSYGNVNWKRWSQGEDGVNDQQLTSSVDSYMDPCQVYMEPTVAGSERESCWFLPNDFPLNDNFLSSENESRALKFKPIKKPCSSFLEGQCSRSDCPFMHEVSNITCRFWIQGSCFKGHTCPFLHAIRRNPVKHSQDVRKRYPAIQMKEPEPETDKNFSLESETDFPSLPGSK